MSKPRGGSSTAALTGAHIHTQGGTVRRVCIVSAQTEEERFARLSDPGPSKDAADLGDSFGPLTEWVLRTLIDVEAHNPGRTGGTSNELQMRMAYDGKRTPDRNSISRRLTSLLRKGYVRDTGERRDGGWGVGVTVYAVTDAGREWLADG